MADRLNANGDLIGIGALTSQDGQTTLVMQGDGNLVVYRPGNKPRWATGTNGRIVAQAVMQGDGNFVLYGPGGTYIWYSATHGNPGAWLTVQNDGNVVIYGPAGNALWATNTNFTRVRVAGFTPSNSGLNFSNSFPTVPLLNINVLGQNIPIGNAANGLCGGMVFTVRDFHEAGMPIPPDTTPPSSGPLFDYMVRRLFDSFNLPAGPATYMHLMNPALPDHETDASRLGIAPKGRAWTMIVHEWPKIKADLDAGRLSPMAMVQIKSLDPFQMGQNHQVLAYGYDLDGTDLKICIYDPNYPNDDTITLSLSIADPQHTTAVTYSKGNTVWCFFRPDYFFSRPSFNVAYEALGGLFTSGPGVASWAPGRLDVFGRGTDNALWHKYYAGGWSGWNQLGPNPIASDPAAVSWGANRIDVFVRGTDNALYHKAWDGTRWTDYEGLGGQLTSGPTVCSWGSGRLDVFARGNDNALWHLWYDGGWSSWERLGSNPIASDPAAVSWGPNRIDVFVRGTDNALYHKWFDGQWSDYESLGGGLTSGPGVCSWAAGRLDIFARGNDSALWHLWYDGGWSSWEQLGANQIIGDPAAESWGPNRIDVFVRGTDNAMWHRYFDGTWRP